MEVEVGESFPSTPPPKRLGLKSTILTNSGDDYIFQIASSEEIQMLAVSTSANAIKLYSPWTDQYLGECVGHSGTINEVSFSAPHPPNMLCSCSSDGTVRMWDVRALKQVSLMRPEPSKEIYCFSFGGSSSNLLAAGCDAQILFWDWRNGKQVACLEESHMDDVTQVRFVPNQQNKLISASVDGLICLFDTDGDIDDDNHLETVMNVETSVSKIGFFGQSNQKLWCLTNIETLSIWDWQDARRDINFADARSLASDKWNLDQVLHVDYFVDCHYSGADDRLWVIGGTNLGTVGYFPVDYQSRGAIGCTEAILAGGHAGVVRSVLLAWCAHGGLARETGIIGWTGGEDGRLCYWSSEELSGANRSWVSTSLVTRSIKGSRKSRHHPY